MDIASVISVNVLAQLDFRTNTWENQVRGTVKFDVSKIITEAVAGCDKISYSS